MKSSDACWLMVLDIFAYDMDFEAESMQSNKAALTYVCQEAKQKDSRRRYAFKGIAHLPSLAQRCTALTKGPPLDVLS